MTILKGIVFFLVLANVGYFLWASGPGGMSVAPSSPSSSHNLRLTSELQGHSDLAPEASAAEAAAASAVAAPGVASPGVATLGMATPGVAAAGVGTPGVATPGMAAAGVSAPGVGGAAPAAPGGDAAAPASGVKTKRCVSVGPFADVALASHASASLRSSGFEPRSRVAEGEVWAGVWVYLAVPPAPSGASQVLATLKRAGIDDALEMPGPNDAPVISLGLFSEPRRAQARMAQAQSLGFDPAVADRKRTGDVYWVDVDLKPADAALNTANLDGETGRIVRLETKPCPAGTAP